MVCLTLPIFDNGAFIFGDVPRTIFINTYRNVKKKSIIKRKYILQITSYLCFKQEGSIFKQ